MLDTERKFYHGTSTVYNIIGKISPSNKSDTKSTLYKRKTAKIRVTDDLEAAKYYATKAVEKKGGEPIIYEVTPDVYSMIKISKTDYCTSSATVVGIINLGEGKDL